MSCAKPLKMWQPSLLISDTPNKKLTTVSSKRTLHILENQDIEFVSSIDNKIEHSGFIRKSTGEFAPVFDIGCGSCYSCRMAYAYKWSVRLLLEKRCFPEDCWFLTLTYDDEHLTPAKKLKGLFTLVKKDVQDFHKRLRWYLYGDDPPPEDKPYRFFLAGEYGDHSFRPHYHEISYNLPIPDLKFYSRQDGYDIYSSRWLSRIWQNGEVWIEEVTPKSCAYTARYCEKKQKKDDSWLYEDAGILPEFTLQSRRPGISGYCGDLVRNDNGSPKSLIALPGGSSSPLPRYCDKFFSDEELLEVKNYRQWRSEEYLSAALSGTSKSQTMYQRDLARVSRKKKNL